MHFFFFAGESATGSKPLKYYEKKEWGNKMKKQIKILLCYMLICICFLNKIIVLADEETYSSEKLEEVHELYKYNESFLDILKKKEAFSYRMIADYYEKHEFMNWATNMSAWFTGEYISEDGYIEILSEIMMMNQYEISEQIAEQGKYNSTKGITDLLSDATDVVFDVDGISLFFNINDKKSNFIYQALKHGEKIWSKGKEFYELTEDGKKYYQALLENYVSSDKFLTAVVNNAEQKKLRNAAKKLIDVNDQMFLREIYYIDKMAGDITEFSAKLFIDEILTPTAEFLEEYASDAATQGILHGIYSWGKTFNEAGLVFNLMMFFANYSFGTSDTFAYLQRIKAIDEIASCIGNEIDKVDIENYTDYIEQYEAIIEKCTWYRWLITIDARGESYACTMLTNANNGLSDIDDLIQEFKGELTTKEKYDRQLDTLVRFDKNYIQPLVDIEVFEEAKSEESGYVSEDSDTVDQYLEFVKQYGEEVFYSIENVKEGRKPVLLLAFPSENEWESEFLDDNSIHSNSCDIYDYIDGEMVYLGNMVNLVGYLSVYEKEDMEYIMTRNNTHSYSFYCVKDDNLYYYAYNTNNIQEDMVEYEKDGEYHNYAYGTINYDNAVGQYSEVGDIVFQKYTDGAQNEKEAVKNSGFDSQIWVDYYNSYEWRQNVLSVENSMYELVDIEQDGIPELVIRNGSDLDVSYYVYYYDKDTAQIRYAGTFDNGFNATPALYYSPSMKALSTYGRTSDSHWDMFYQLDHGEISLMSFETGWFDSKNDKYIRHYYMLSNTKEREEIASADWEDEEACREAAEKYYSYISDLEYISFGSAISEICYSHGENMLSQNCRHAIYSCNQINKEQNADTLQGVEAENAEMEYIIPDSDSRYLTRDELTSLTSQQCNYARNEIYARKGRKFHSIELQEYFATKEWYEPLYEPEYFDANIENFCNDYEIKNGEIILAYESEKGKYELNQPGYNIYLAD